MYQPQTIKISLIESTLGTYVGDLVSKQLYLPLEKTINNKFHLKVTQETRINAQYYKEIATTYAIQPIYFNTTWIKYLRLSWDFPVYNGYNRGVYIHDVQAVERGKNHYNKLALIYLNDIEYILSLPLEELPLHLEEAYPYDDLVLWRLELPRERRLNL